MSAHGTTETVSLLEEIERFTGLCRMDADWINVGPPSDDLAEARRLLAKAYERIEALSALKDAT